MCQACNLQYKTANIDLSIKIHCEYFTQYFKIQKSKINVYRDFL